MIKRKEKNSKCLKVVTLFVVFDICALNLIHSLSPLSIYQKKKEKKNER